MTTIRSRPNRSADILAVFTRKVAQHGYDGTNLGEIAGELGISKGTIVHHYGTKDRLLAILHESYMRRRLAEARRIVERLGSPAERLAALLYAFMIYQVHDRDATVAFQREITRLTGAADHATGVALRAEYRSLITDVLADGVASGQFRTTDPRVGSLLVFGSAQWAWTWFDPDGPRSAEEVGAALVDIVLGGLLVRRRNLARLTDPAGAVPRLVHECLTAQPATTEPSTKSTSATA